MCLEITWRELQKVLMKAAFPKVLEGLKGWLEAKEAPVAGMGDARTDNPY